MKNQNDDEGFDYTRAAEFALKVACIIAIAGLAILVVALGVRAATQSPYSSCLDAGFSAHDCAHWLSQTQSGKS